MSAIIDRLREFTRPTGEEDLMDVDYPTPRVRVGLREAAVVAGILLLLFFGWLGWSGIRAPGSGPETPTPAAMGVPLDQVTVGTPETVPTGTEEQEAVPAGMTGTLAPAPEEVVVSVVGEVLHPGLVTLAPGARVADALALAVPRDAAELQSLNLAQKLKDGEQVHVSDQAPEVPASGIEGVTSEGSLTGGTGSDATGKISLNAADTAELMTLSGVGEKTAAAIIAHREAIGGFQSIEQLQEVKGIGPAKFAALRDQISP